ncbi:uncharacterized protein LOC116613876 [Nematostella vectensis]|uniref:uncharacterized protein LOC116613876 n=1 Tax=Nematostella vectensis TaxID=45351 RepID=UPI00207739E4|nr:uncharacterized protein LOC116613876 [Nematostella vectensis]
MAALILARLVHNVKEALGDLVEVGRQLYWSDSMTVLYWLENKGEWKQFVRHRVDEILRLTEEGEWKHWSRGALASKLKSSTLWWNGPSWLSETEKGWPKTEIRKTTAGAEEEKSTVCMVVNNERQAEDISAVIDINRFCDCGKLFRVTAYVHRFVHNVKTDKAHRKTGRLSSGEIDSAELLWIKSAQLDVNEGKGYKQLTHQLGLVEVSGLLRCRGRLGNSELEADARMPIILPRQHRLTEMLILDCHRKFHHCGVRGTLTQLRTRYWVPQGRQVVKGLLRRSVTCRRLEGRAYAAPPEADLPDFRVRHAEPFSKVGVDFAGPLYYKGNTGMQKAYVALFSCCVTRALHLDLVEDLEETTFRRCLRRFAARRGAPTLIVSDNAKTFKVTAQALQRLYDHPEVQAYLETHRITWRFNLEKAPWWGGFYERMVGSVKRCLRKTLGEARLTFDELLTVLIEVESTLYDRPLTYVYNEIGDEALTPAHLMYGRRLHSLPDEVVEPDDVRDGDHNSRIKYLSAKLSHFWKRWSGEYLTSLREFHCAHRDNEHRETVQVGDVVTVHDDGSKRNQWKIAVVEQLIKGRDDIVRGARVRLVTKGKPQRLDRPVQRLYPIEVRCADATHGTRANSGGNVQARARSTRAAALRARDKIAIGAVLD